MTRRSRKPADADAMTPGRRSKPPLSVEQILRWADLHHERTGEWPQAASGQVADAPDESWSALDSALRQGMRGLPFGRGLPILLRDERGVRKRGRRLNTSPRRMPKKRQKILLTHPTLLDQLRDPAFKPKPAEPERKPRARRS